MATSATDSSVRLNSKQWISKVLTEVLSETRILFPPPLISIMADYARYVGSVSTDRTCAYRVISFCCANESNGDAQTDILIALSNGEIIRHNSNPSPIPGT